jgi:Kelch motif
MTWTISKPIHRGPRLEACGTVLLDGRVLVTGGSSSVGVSAILDPATMTWSPTNGTLAGERHRHGLVTLADGQVLAIGGGSDYHALARCDLFDPQTEKWHPAPPLPGARHSFACVQVGGRVLTFGGIGQGNSRTAAVDAWTPGGSAWVALAPIPDWPIASDHYSACPVADGSVFVTNGYRAWQFDPVAVTWREVGTKLIQSRSALVAFEDGVAMLGGEISPVSALAQTRLWSAAGGWRDGIALPASRAGCDALVLDDGRIAIVGGYGIETTTHRRELTGGELDFEYRTETSQSVAWSNHGSSLIGTPRSGWISTPSPELGGVRALRLPAGIAAVTRDGRVAVWRPL